MSAVNQSTKSMRYPMTLLSVMLGTSVLLTACGGDEHHEVHAVDKVEEAAEMAKSAAPAPVDLELGESTAAPAEDAAMDESKTEEGEEAVAEATETDAADAESEIKEETKEEIKEEAEAEPEVKEEAVAPEKDEEKAEAAAPAEVVLAADAGKKLYDSACVACHATGLLNAPKMGDKAAWAERISKGRELLAEHSANGFNQMPAQAINGVSVEQVHAAVDYMIEQSS